MDAAGDPDRSPTGVAHAAEASLHSDDRPPALSAARIAVPASSASPAAAGATIDAPFLRSALGRARRTIDRHAVALTKLDAVLGDGDHGDNLAIGFRAVEEALAELPAETLPAELLRAVGHRLVSAVGGASGPLYGTAFIEAGFRAGTAATIDLALAAEMLEAATDGLARRGRCAVGDKTILDTLRPAATALSEAIARGAGASVAARAMVEAARTGMRGTRPMVARRGIALRLGPRSVGHLDPGAVSCFLILRAVADR
jgi:dihydroxyacetone kinase-like protein